MNRTYRYIGWMLLAFLALAIIISAIRTSLASINPGMSVRDQIFTTDQLEDRLASTDQKVLMRAIGSASINVGTLTEPQAEALIAVGLDGRFPTAESLQHWQRAILLDPELFRPLLAASLADCLEEQPASPLDNDLLRVMEMLQALEPSATQIDLGNRSSAVAALRVIANDR